MGIIEKFKNKREDGEAYVPTDETVAEYFYREVDPWIAEACERLCAVFSTFSITPEE